MIARVPLLGSLVKGWANLPIARKGALAVLLPIQALLVGFVLLYFVAHAERTAQASVDRTVQVRYLIRTILTQLLTAESSQRGLAISGNNDFLAPYEAAARDVSTSLQELAALLGDNPAQVRRVRELQIPLDEEFRLIRALQKTAGSSAASGAAESIREAERTLPRVRAKLEEIDGEEARVQMRRVAKVEQVRDLSLAANAGTVGLGLLGAIAGISLLSRSVVRRVRRIGENADRLARELPLLPSEGGDDEVSGVERQLEMSSHLLATRTAALREETSRLHANIAQREEAETALRDSEARLQAILDHTNAVVYVKDLESRFQLVNRQFEMVVGLSRECIRGQTSLDLFGEELGAPLIEHDREVLQTKAPHEFEEVMQLSGAERVYISLKFPLLDRKGEPYALCGISTDITGRKAGEMALRTSKEQLESSVRERTAELEQTNSLLRQEIAQHLETAETLKQTQEQYLHAQKLEALGLLASGVAHDFNNILTAIMGYGTVLLDRVPAAERDTSHEAEILRAASRAAGLSKQLLSFSRRQTYQPTNLNLSALVLELHSMLRKVIGERVTLETELFDDIGSVHADAGQIEQMLMNLVVNARDAMPGDGTIVIATRAVSLPPEAVKTETESTDFIALSVRDNGTGIPSEVMAKMFEPFFTTKHPGQGTGLGLATCCAIAQRSGGWLACDSTLGIGTEFTLYLPRITAAADLRAPKLDDTQLRSGSETILVVEDEPAVGDVLALLLSSLGYDVIRAEDGEQAEMALNTRGGAAIDLVLTDLNMPRMNGRQLMERLAVANPKLKVLLTSGNDELLDEQAAAELRVDFLPKPFTMQMLATKVRAVLDA